MSTDENEKPQQNGSEQPQPWYSLLEKPLERFNESDVELKPAHRTAADPKSTFTLRGKIWSRGTKDNFGFVVQIVHGFGEHSAVYRDTVAELFERFGEETNFAVFSADHYGHGRSDGDRAYLLNFDEVTKDAIEFAEHCLKLLEIDESSNKPIFLFGHSLGGPIAINMMQQTAQQAEGTELSIKYNSCVLVAPFLRVHSGTAPNWAVRLGRIVGKVLPRVRFSKIDSALISHDKFIVDFYDRDELTYHEGARLGCCIVMADFAESMLQAAAEFRGPFLMVIPSDDQICAPEAMHEFYTNAVKASRTRLVIEGSYHQCHHETAAIRDRFLTEIVNWLKKRLET